MEIIQAIIDFVFGNIAIVIWLLIIFLGAVSASRKKKQAEARRQQEQGSTRGFKDILAEIEEELRSEEEFEEQKESSKPYCPMAQEDDRRGRPYVTANKAPQKAFTKKDTPWTAKTELPKTEKIFPVPNSEVISVTMDSIEKSVPEKEPDLSESRRQDFSRAGLVQAVVMSEILGKPKSLQDEIY